MFNLFLELPLFAGILLFLLCIVSLGIIVFFSSHYFYIKRKISKGQIQVGRVLFRTSASLLALLLSFTFASQRVDYYKIKQSLEYEASQLVDIHIDLGLFDSPSAEPIRKNVREYVGIMLEEGWKPITETPFESSTFVQFLGIYKDIHNLEANNALLLQLKESLIADIDEVSDYLQVRFYQTRPETPVLIYIALFGFLVVMIFFSVYTPDKVSITFISLFNAFIGLVLYFILLMNNPFVGPIQIKPEPFQILQDAMDAQ
jgi:hypothetical protein